ncbi:hypothetical protein GH714_005230 [Hevea brasiliensis]|uniref:ABC transmembrane type-1 domain-containing protein n=1 Tax=Hevea brasiliensis TaxID=3981 RepID=A0A6A6MBL7_HEVBR|nr:hypothetical protein GH714_005230 [Hevea brasiliensis]
MNITTFLTGQLVALYLSWKLAAVAIPALLMLMIPGMLCGKLISGIGEKIQAAYEVAGGTAEQAVSSIRTVYSSLGEDRTINAYKIALEPTLNLGIKQGLMKGMAMGTIGVTFAVWALQGCSLGGALINVKFFMEANIAASNIFEMIHRVPTIDSANQQGKTMAEVKGEVEFQDIDFEYPSRPGCLVLCNFSLRVIAGHTVGLVGKSAFGKFTVINLLQRFYEPPSGEIFLDDVGIRNSQLRWLRSQMGLVSQEPILFGTSIKENILSGKEEAASLEEVITAAKAANAHNFISQLPHRYDTVVINLFSRTIGYPLGQKQRISIARALLRNPRILLLDEATSALDLQSEKVVQDASNQASIGRTTIIIAHRLSALRNVDLIAVIQSGTVVESGSHD